ncbi:hypothetical protein E4T52_08064 [Aureobasidium sp. EXF-3400]|nr:hypothetical protein E4T51_07023 [Aureobasidium sp. EXF-12344]KAI4776976.1 hypothetical protein E4T52_08064 [Aureobasidium sp. EXF-3400]
MALSTLKRLSRAFSSRDTTADAVDSCDAASQPENAQELMNGQPHIHRRSSPKASVYEHSPAQFATTLHDPDHAPTNVSAHDSTGSSDAIVQVLTIGDSIITVETHRRDDEEAEEPVPKRRRKSFGLRRVKTAPPTTQRVPLRGSTTTIESTHNDSRLRAWSFPLVSWKNLSLVRRVRRSVDLKEARKEARKGKASCEMNFDRQFADNVNGSDIADDPNTMMSGARQGSPPHVNRPADELDISPRTSVFSRTGPNISGQNGNHQDHSNDEQINRKDSHFHDLAQAKEKDTELLASTRKLSSDERSSTNLAFWLHPIDWFRQYHSSIFNLDYSDSSSSSASSPPPSPTTRLARPARRVEKTPIPRTRPAKRRFSLGPTRDEDELYTEPQLNLPPGLEPPVAGQAGPADWLHRGWEEHYRKSAEASHRACHPLAAARCLPTRAEEMQRYNPGSSCQVGCQSGQVQRANSVSYAGGIHARSLDFPAGWKGKGVGNPPDFGVEHRVRRVNSQGACVTTITLSECKFTKELEQTATSASENCEQK